jgi:mannose/fructose/N-acetylgalactosamine-specific phosphotransferase system component IIC
MPIALYVFLYILGGIATTILSFLIIDFDERIDEEDFAEVMAVVFLVAFWPVLFIFLILAGIGFVLSKLVNYLLEVVNETTERLQKRN